MNRTFNNGIGMVIVVAAEEAQATAATLRQLGETVYTIGNVTGTQRRRRSPSQIVFLLKRSSMGNSNQLPIV